MAGPQKPIVLLADSQLLFWEQDGEPFLSRIRGWLEVDQPQIAYLGASNGDRPEYFELFRGALAKVGLDQCRAIPSRPGTEDLEFLDRAALILLAGGDPLEGWRAFERSGLKDRLLECYGRGAVLMGVSAGAMQLGLWGIGENHEAPFPTLQLVPFVVDAHDEPRWSRLHEMVRVLGPSVRGLGIPSGGGVFVHRDGSLESVRRPFCEVGR